MPTSSMRNS